MQKLSSLVLVGAAALAGCSDSTSPSVSAVFPESGFLGRDVRVEIVGDATKFKDGASVDFGDGVTVNKVSLGSPTSLFADITITGTATAGLHDVTVTSGGSKALVLSQAFEIKPAITMTIDGNKAQGSVAFVTIKNHDLENLFDTTNDGNPFGATFTNISVMAGTGVTFNVSNVTPFEIDATMTVDIDGASGPLSVISGVGQDAVTTPLGEDLKIDARTPTTLAANTPTQGMVVNPYDTQLFEFTPGNAPALNRIAAIVPPNSGFTPQIALLPESGKFADLITFSASINDLQTVTGKYYLVILDNSGAAGYSYTLRASSLSGLNRATETASNDTVATAQAITLPAWLDGASLPAVTDKDFLKFTATAAMVGKKVHVITLPGDPRTDTLVDVMTGTNGNTSLGESDDLNYHEDFVSSPITAAGTVWVEISASQGGFYSTSQTHYLGFVFLE